MALVPKTKQKVNEDTAYATCYEIILVSHIIKSGAQKDDEHGKESRNLENAQIAVVTKSEFEQGNGKYNTKRLSQFNFTY